MLLGVYDEELEKQAIREEEREKADRRVAKEREQTEKGAAFSLILQHLIKESIILPQHLTRHQGLSSPNRGSLFSRFRHKRNPLQISKNNQNPSSKA